MVFFRMLAKECKKIVLFLARCGVACFRLMFQKVTFSYARSLTTQNILFRGQRALCSFYLCMWCFFHLFIYFQLVQYVIGWHDRSTQISHTLWRVSLNESTTCLFHFSSIKTSIPPQTEKKYHHEVGKDRIGGVEMFSKQRRKQFSMSVVDSVLGVAHKK